MQILPWIFLIPAACAWSAGAPPVFPIQKGTYWIYRGEVAWADPDNHVHSRKLDWKMEVTDEIQRGRYKAAWLLGSPFDLMWYQEGKPRRCHLGVAVDEKSFCLVDCPALQAAHGMLTERDLRALTRNDGALIFKLPLRQGEVFAQIPNRDDTMYGWCVETVKQTALLGIHGVPEAGMRTQYELFFREVSDHQIATYVPGIGLTSYVYSHHGTKADTDVRLVEFHPGR